MICGTVKVWTLLLLLFGEFSRLKCSHFKIRIHTIEQKIFPGVQVFYRFAALTNRKLVNVFATCITSGNLLHLQVHCDHTLSILNIDINLAQIQGYNIMVDSHL